MVKILKPNAVAIACKDCDKPAYHKSDVLDINIGKYHARWERFWSMVMTFESYLEDMLEEERNDYTS